MNDLTFAKLRIESVNRCHESFFPLYDWSPADWATAMAGECGEACNLLKKARRMVGPEMSYENALASLCDEIAKELADTVTYVDLLAARLGIDLGAAIAAKFNEVSDRVGSCRRLPD